MLEDKNYNIYQTKINELIQSNNLNYFVNELLLQPNLVFSAIHFEGEPYLYHIGNLSHDTDGHENKTAAKMFDVFLACLHHYTNEYFNNNNNNNDYFISKYLNYPNCGSLFRTGYSLWGISGRYLRTDTHSYKLMKQIMESKYFYGLSTKNFSVITNSGDFELKVLFLFCCLL